jgi:hypothetical protein
MAGQIGDEIESTGVVSITQNRGLPDEVEEAGRKSRMNDHRLAEPGLALTGRLPHHR